MGLFRDARMVLWHADDSNYINGKECLLLYYVNTFTNPHLPQWLYEPFDLENLYDDVCKTQLRFWKEIYTTSMKD